ncbi:MAG: lamin tail domain-containing protein [Verrucomicrobia bacterium]|nr:lamin tail domain-containing protein [Verrucomicrobiota bacterium]
MKRLIGLLSVLNFAFLTPFTSPAQAPANDNFADAWLIAGHAVATNGNSGTTTTTYATKETGEPNHGGFVGGRSVWYQWLAPTGGVTCIDTLGSGFNTMLGVYTGSVVSALGLVVSNDNISGVLISSRVYFMAEQGTLYRVAVDGRNNSGGQARSGPYNLNLQMLPFAYITTPAKSTTVYAGTNLYIRAEASSPNGAVTNVAFYRNSILFHNTTASPYEITYTNLPAGTNVFYVVARDIASQVWTSAVANVIALIPGVAITFPANGASFFGTAPIPITASAVSSSTTSVAKVEFFNHGGKIGEDTASPYGLFWNTAVPGSNRLSAVMTDTTGLLVTSAPVNITVTGQSLVLTGSVWKYLDNGSDQGTAWAAPGFDDSGWAAGPAELGYGDGVDGRPEATTNSFGPDSANKYITTYYRRAFVATNIAACTNLVLRVLRDDGAVVHLNGVEAARFNVAAGTVNYLTLVNNATDDGALFFPTNINPTLLVEGTNVLAVEVHQSTLNSSDLSFDLELVALIDPAYTIRPFVTLTAPANGAAVVAPHNLFLSATASSTNSTVASVEFFSNGALVGTVTTPPYDLTLSNVSAGTYSVKAVVTDGLGVTNTSATATVTVWGATGSRAVAFFDYGRGAGTGPNVLSFDVNNAAGPLTNRATGETLAESLTLTTVGSPTGGNVVEALPAGTPAYDVFNGHCDLSGICAAYMNTPGQSCSILLNNLNPLFRYRLVGTVNRNNAAYTNRITRVELLGADALVPAHTAGVVASGLAVNQADLICYNPTGEYVAWTDIAPGADGTIELRSSMATTNVAYALSALRVEAFAPVPQIALTAPTNGAVFQAPTNVALSATASGFGGVTNVQFFGGASLLGQDATAPFSFTWTDAPVGVHPLTAVAFDSLGGRGTSSVVSITVNPPPTNSTAPFVLSQVPVAGATVPNTLTSIQVTFSESVTGVTSGDLLVNSAPALGVSGSNATYTFTVASPPYGPVQVTWAASHGIADRGVPPLSFDGAAVTNTWSYNLVDRAAPTVVSQDPLAGSVVSNLAQLTVTFSEAVTGVNASDLLINGSPAFGLVGGNDTYTFAFSQPAAGTISVTWDAAHGITDLASPPNAFDAAGAGAMWQYTLDSRTIFVQSNSVWGFVKAFAEASTPIDAWRQPGFDDAIWSNAPMPFFYGDTAYTNAQNPGTAVNDMQGGAYSSLYGRKTFTVANAAAVTNLQLRAQSDDGFIAWLNGVEVVRYNMGAGDIPYNGSAPGPINEPGGNGAAYILYPLTNGPAALVDGTNVLAIHAFNNQPLTSSDFGINAQLFGYAADAGLVAPRLLGVSPAAGSLFSLSSVTVTFTEPVQGVEASDLLVNGVPATGLTGGDADYVFTFAQPAYGPVAITWATGHGITDFDTTPKPFDGAALGSTWQYTLLNPNAPVVAAQDPLAGATVGGLTQITVTFNKPVTGVNASDLLVNGAPASTLQPFNASTYAFTFPQPPLGNVTVAWAANHGIADTEVPANAFDATRPSSTWSYTLLDLAPPAVAAKDPPAGAGVTNLTQVQVTFSEPVAGVNASDLLINGVAATSLSGSGSNYTFSFPQPNATVITVTWAANHGIADLATTPNAFDAQGPGATWQYQTPDTVAPTVVAITPTPFATVRALADLTITFTEAVTGVDAGDLLINSAPAQAVGGSGAGPYTFLFPTPPNGAVEVRWTLGHGIHDLASPSNAFAGGEWTYTLDPNASFAGKVLINEIMFDPAGGARSNEWIELHNIAADPVNLAGWRFTKGVDFTFSNVTLPAGGYLVVAADPAAFRVRFPTVTNVVGGWLGSLANSDENLELETVLGEKVNSVHYASEGDWARRERGIGSDQVLSITRNGSTATVTVFGHGYTGGDHVIITGATQPEYNGRFAIASLSGPSAFNITVSGTPATPATGNIACHHVLDDAFSGWTWFCAAAGFGNSLELINPALPNGSGQNWLTSAAVGGTPGRANSVATNNVAPLVEDVTHFPPVPKSTDPVGITARVQDELTNGVTAVTLFYRNHTGTSPGAFTGTGMFDDGAHSDGVARDGLYGAVLPAMGNGTVIEFYVQATDTAGLVRTWPAPATDTNGPSATYGTPGQFANALYQVDNEIITNTMPALRLVLSGTERAIFPPNNRNSDAAMNCTLLSTDGDGVKVRYRCVTRVRGAGTRGRNPPNNRIDIPNDNRWNNLAAINLNSQFVHAQLLGGVLALKSGVAAEKARVVQYRINGSNPAPITAPVNGSGQGAGWGAFVLLEPPNGDLASDIYPLNGGGNYYRVSSGGHAFDFTYQNGNLNAYLSRGIYKTSNRTENDWSDLERLDVAMSQVTVNADYIQAVSTNVNVGEWMRYFALGSLMNYGETALFNGIGDDSAMYRGLADPRFVLIGHDFDTIFGQGDTGAGSYPINTNSSIFVMLNPPNPNGAPGTLQTQLRRFFTNAAFAPVFYAELKKMCDTTFNPANLDPLVDQLLGTWGGIGPDATTIANIKSYAACRRAVALSQIPLTLTVGHTLGTSGGLPYTTTPNVTLFGSANAIDTRRVLVAGAQANWNAFNARWTNTVALAPGINRVHIQSLDSNNVEFARVALDIWYDDASVQTVSGAIAANTIWTAANGPYQVTANLTINNGATLTIQAGTTVYLAAGVNLTVANGGRLLAEGADTAHIRFSRVPGGGNWGGITVNGGAGSPETRIAYADFEANGSTAIHSSGGTVFLDHLTFGNTAVQYLSLDGSSFVVQDCVFPSATGLFELVHGNGGLKAGGRGLFLRNFFGVANSVSGNFNDVVDFTGGNRPGPILQFLDNVFIGSGDDLLDLDGTDAWIEGNIFLHAHKNGSPDSSSAISGGLTGSDRSEITIVGNLIYDCDQAANAKEGNFYTFYNNTIVRTTKRGGTDTVSCVGLLADVNTAEGAGLHFEGNIIDDAEQLVYGRTNAVVTFTNNLISRLAGAAWTGPGGNNGTNDPLFKYVPAVTETSNFTSWASAQVLWDWFSLRTGSPAVGAGPNGRDQGAVASAPSPLGGERAGVRGASISGEPIGTTPLTSATLKVGLNRTGSGIPAGSWANGSGFTHYRWRRDGGGWSVETPIATPITLTGLSSGPHYVEVVGKNDAGFYQDDAAFGVDAVISRSRTWTVNPAASPLRINEVLAANDSAVNHNGTTPDMIELYNAGPTTLDLSGVRLTDTTADPDLFLFPPGTTLAAGGYLVLYANDPDGTPGFHLGFNLSQEGDTFYLYDSAANGGALIDSVSFGPQIPDLSIGRLASPLPSDGSGAGGEGWALTRPTFGAPNQAMTQGDRTRLKINEWLAAGQSLFANDFIELYNPDPQPVSLGGLYLTDNPLGWPDQHQIAALSFIPAYGYLRFFADADAGQGPDHLNFQLSPDQGSIALSLPDLTVIDSVVYQAQWPDLSQGRSPNGSSPIYSFIQPTPGGPNPLIRSATAGQQVVPLVLLNQVWRYNQDGFDLGTAWRAVGYDDTNWPSGAGALGYENGNNALSQSLTNTVLNLANQFGTNIPTFYFRTHFTFTNVAASVTFVLTNLLDDAEVIYLNGAELFRQNLPSGPIDFGTIASVNSEAALAEATVTPTNLVQGDNVLAVEVHQSTLSSASDIMFGLAVTALITTNQATPASVVLNEVLANNAGFAELDGTTPDWVELYNQSAGPVDLSDLSLTDDSTLPRRWVFPPGSVIAGGGYLRLFCDADKPATNNNTGFGLKITGDAIYLFDAPANGGSLLDAVAFGLQAADFSVGRIPNGTGAWALTYPSSSAANVAAPLGNALNLKVNEWMADPSSGDDWFELFNPESLPVSLGGYCLTDDLNNRTKQLIAPLSFIGVSTNGYQMFRADGNTGAGADHVSFSLKASGEAVGLSTPAGTLIDGYAFTSQDKGVSEGRFPDGGAVIVRFPGTDSPGDSNWRLLDSVVVNEVLTHTDPPLEDAIELRNFSAQAIDLGGWWLSDDKGFLRKYQIPFGTTLPANGYAVFYENVFSNRVLAAMPFSLGSKGDEVTLSASSNGVLTGYRATAKFGAAENGVSFGRYVTSDAREEFVALSARSFGQDDPGSLEQFRLGTGASNAYPKVGPIVISEIMYHPPDMGTNDNPRDEFIELHNTGTVPVALYHPAYPTNTWRLRDAVDFNFPTNVVLPAGGDLVIVSFDPVNDPATLAVFRTNFSLGADVAILGPYSVKLANSDAKVELYKPDAPVLPPDPDAGQVPYILVERIHYYDSGFWPIGPDGGGSALQRTSLTQFGNDPANWTAATPTPGHQPSAGEDTDGDGMPDAWELAHQLNPNSPTDRNTDADGDGLSNFQEYQAGTDPRDPLSVLRFQTINPVPATNGVELVFRAMAGQSYTIQYSDQINPMNWQRLTDVDAAGMDRVIALPAPMSVTHRFYRIVTPKQ